jgi:hypothetical protein
MRRVSGEIKIRARWFPKYRRKRVQSKEFLGLQENVIRPLLAVSSSGAVHAATFMLVIRGLSGYGPRLFSNTSRI